MQIPTRIKTLIVTIGVGLAVIVPYFKAGIVSGYMATTPDIAAYEKLLGKLGTATSANETNSLTSSFVVILIVIGNALYWYPRWQEKKVKVKVK